MVAVDAAFDDARGDGDDISVAVVVPSTPLPSASVSRCRARRLSAFLPTAQLLTTAM
jgi:hypothetical protein